MKIFKAIKLRIRCPGEKHSLEGGVLKKRKCRESVWLSTGSGVQAPNGTETITQFSPKHRVTEWATRWSMKGEALLRTQQKKIKEQRQPVRVSRTSQNPRATWQHRT